MANDAIGNFTITTTQNELNKVVKFLQQQQTRQSLWLENLSINDYLDKEKRADYEKIHKLFNEWKTGEKAPAEMITLIKKYNSGVNNPHMWDGVNWTKRLTFDGQDLIDVLKSYAKDDDDSETEVIITGTVWGAWSVSGNCGSGGYRQTYTTDNKEEPSLARLTELFKIEFDFEDVEEMGMCFIEDVTVRDGEVNSNCENAETVFFDKNGKQLSEEELEKMEEDDEDFDRWELDNKFVRTSEKENATME